MPFAMFLVLQSAAPAAAAPALNAATPCRAGKDGEIVVCGNRGAQERYRLRPLAPRFEESPVRAATPMAGGTIGLVTEQKMIAGAPSNRLLVRWKTRF